jgi:homoserine kinase
MDRYHRENGYLACPHTAVGLVAASKALPSLPEGTPMISLATAHPGKFRDAVRESIGGDFTLPVELSELLGLETRVLESPNSVAHLKSIIEAVVARAPGHEQFLGTSSFSLRVPASSANLGPGFDVLGLALGLHLRVSVTRSHDPSSPVTLTFEGEGKASVSTGSDNLLLAAARTALAKATSSSSSSSAASAASSAPSSAPPSSSDPSALPRLPGCAIHVTNEIPLARGLGSSSTAIVAGVMLANRLCSLSLSRDAVFSLCVEIEGHADNVCAAVYGGLQACVVAENGTAWSQSVRLRRDIRPVVAVPSFELSTAKARQVLPLNYSRQDLVFNLAR